MEKYIEVTKNEIEYNLIHLPQVVFEVTDACNLRCKYCGYAELYEGYDKRENKKLSFIKAKRIIDYLCEIWDKHYCDDAVEPVNIGFYGGEPLLNVPFIQQVITYVEELCPKGKKFFYSMTTNAMLLDKYMDFLVEKQFRLLISLDGDKEGQGYRVDVTGHNSFDRVFANINLLRERYPVYFDKLVRFNAVLHNKNSVESIIRFTKEMFGKEPTISPLNNSGIRKDKIEEFNKTYRNYEESLSHAQNCEALREEIFIKNPQTRNALNYLYNYSGNVFFNYNELLINFDNLPKHPTGTCSPFSKKMFVTVNGRILQCERINHEFALGKVTDESVELNLEQAAEQHNQYIFKYMRQCKNCGIQKFCPQCVYQIDDINDVKSNCLSCCSSTQLQRQKMQALEHLAQHPALYKRLLTEVTIRK